MIFKDPPTRCFATLDPVWNLDHGDVRDVQFLECLIFHSEFRAEQYLFDVVERFLGALLVGELDRQFDQFACHGVGECIFNSSQASKHKSEVKSAILLHSIFVPIFMSEEPRQDGGARENGPVDNLFTRAMGLQVSHSSAVSCLVNEDAMASAPLQQPGTFQAPLPPKSAGASENRVHETRWTGSPEDDYGEPVLMTEMDDYYDEDWCPSTSTEEKYGLSYTSTSTEENYGETFRGTMLKENNEESASISYPEERHEESDDLSSAKGAPISNSYIVEVHLGQYRNSVSNPVCFNAPLYRAYKGVGELLDLWLDWADKRVEVVSVPNYVREVCTRCFCGCKRLRFVTFAASSKLERICTEAFCKTKLMSVTIPDGVVELGERCFFGCTCLRRVTFGAWSKLERICSHAFYDASVELLALPDSVVEIGVNCFTHSLLRRVTFGASSKLERICASAFFDTKLTSITIPPSVLELGNECFRNCEKLRRVRFSPISRIEAIGHQCFVRTRLQSLRIPSSVQKLGGGILCDHSPKRGVSCCEPSAFLIRHSLLLNKDASICHGYIGRVIQIDIPDTVVELCEKCFYWSSSVRQVNFGTRSRLRRIGARAFSLTQIGHVAIPGSVIELGRGCFSQAGLQNVTFGVSSKLERMGDEAFHDTKLESVAIPDSVVELGEKCFEGTRKLRTVTLSPSSRLETIGDMCFAGTHLESFTIPGSVRKLGSGVFRDCSLQGGLSCCQPSAFIMRDSLLLNKDASVCYGSTCRIIQIAIPDSVVELSKLCFCHCNVQCVTFGASSRLERICAEAFLFTKLESVVIPDSVVELDDQCFQYSNLRRITFGALSGLERIGAYALANTWIESVTIPDSVVEIDDSSFHQNDDLRLVTFGAWSRLERIGPDAFGNASLESVAIPDSVVDLGEKCFMYCSRLRQVTFGESSNLEHVGWQAFKGTKVKSLALPVGIVEDVLEPFELQPIYEKD